MRSNQLLQGITEKEVWKGGRHKTDAYGSPLSSAGCVKALLQCIGFRPLIHGEFSKLTCVKICP